MTSAGRLWQARFR